MDNLFTKNECGEDDEGSKGNNKISRMKNDFPSLSTFVSGQWHVHPLSPPAEENLWQNRKLKTPTIADEENREKASINRMWNRNDFRFVNNSIIELVHSLMDCSTDCCCFCHIHTIYLLRNFCAILTLRQLSTNNVSCCNVVLSHVTLEREREKKEKREWSGKFQIQQLDSRRHSSKKSSCMMECWFQFQLTNFYFLFTNSTKSERGHPMRMDWAVRGIWCECASTEKSWCWGEDGGVGGKWVELESKINYKCNRLETILFLFFLLFSSFLSHFYFRLEWLVFSSRLRTLVDEVGYDNVKSFRSRVKLFWMSFSEGWKRAEQSHKSHNRAQVCMRERGSSQMQKHQNWILVEYQNSFCSDQKSWIEKSGRAFLRFLKVWMGSSRNTKFRQKRESCWSRRFV